MPAWHRFLILTCIIFAGEIIFSLPFHIARFFRPTMLEALLLTNTQLGDIFAIYGITAMLAYFPGGMIADRFSYRKLMAFSLWSTAAGGVYLYQLPGLNGMMALFAFWGFTSILLFWAAMIKATRDWAGDNSQGLGFGLLDGGRGLVASVFASVAVFILSHSLADNADVLESKQQALKNIIIFYSLVTAVAGVLCWLLLGKQNPTAACQETASSKLREVTGNPKVWLQGAIVIAAYCGYKGLDNYGIYATQVLHMDDVGSAQFTTLGSYLRPLAAVVAGILADRWLASRIIGFLFAFLMLAFGIMYLFSPASLATYLITANLLITFAAVYGLRGVYFSLLEESRVKTRMTGTAVGVISVVGFTPDIFFAPITGRILDADPGLVGFQNYFLLLAAISLAGLICAIFLNRQTTGNRSN